MRTTRTITSSPAVSLPAAPARTALPPTVTSTVTSNVPATPATRPCRPAPARRTVAPCATVPAPADHERRLVLVDIENVVGGSTATVEQVALCLQLVHQQVQRRDHDVWVVACGAALLRTAMTVLPRTVRLGRGVDGADHQLLEYLEPAGVVGRFASVVVVSGDGQAFAAPVAALRAVGVPTDVVARQGSIGHGLYRTARSFTPLATPEFALAA